MTNDFKILELFAGSCSFSNTAISKGYKKENIFTSDCTPFDSINYVCDILDFNINEIPFQPHIIWASQPCTTFSIASCGHHWTPEKEPKTKECERGIEIVLKTLDIIKTINPKFYFIENPRGLLRKMDFMQDIPRTTVTYCQYETDKPLNERRMKPTDIWTNNLERWIPKRMCKNGAPCHVAAPRGSRTGTQGLKNNYERSKVPFQLCSEILNSCYEY